MENGRKTKPVHLRLRPEECKHLDGVVDSVSGTRTELMRESIYLLIRLWNVCSTESEKREFEPDYADSGLFLRSVDSNPEAVLGLKR